MFLEDISLLTDQFQLGGMSTPVEGHPQAGQADNPPLPVATLKGRQELVLKFTEINQFGLPRAVDEVEVGLGLLTFHIFPHQVSQESDTEFGMNVGLIVRCI